MTREPARVLATAIAAELLWIHIFGVEPVRVLCQDRPMQMQNDHLKSCGSTAGFEEHDGVQINGSN